MSDVLAVGVQPGVGRVDLVLMAGALKPDIATQAGTSQAERLPFSTRRIHKV